MLNLKEIVIIVILIFVLCALNSSQNKEQFSTNPNLHQQPFTPETVQYKCDSTTDRLKDIRNYTKNNCDASVNKYTNYRQNNDQFVENQDVRDTSNTRLDCHYRDEQDIVYDISSSSWCSINESLKAPNESRANKHIDNPLKTQILKDNKQLLENRNLEQQYVNNYLQNVNSYII